LLILTKTYDIIKKKTAVTATNNLFFINSHA
jgi:hypothetical protein